MGLITGILTLPLAPVRGAGWVLKQVVDAAEREYRDTSDIRARLVALEQELLAGQISEEEFDRAEDQLLDEMAERERGDR